MKLLEWLRLPEIRDIEDLDDPSVTLLHAEILMKKPFLRRIYLDFYNRFKEAIPEKQDKVLVELGSGAGFIKEVMSDVITSDVLDLPVLDKVFSALDMPFEDNSVDAFFMIDVLHHLTDPRRFFAEALRCLSTGGKVVMIEPANTLWSRFIYRNFHHELFDTQAGWALEDTGPLSCGNGAMPWIIFSRDRGMFEREFPAFRIVSMRNHTPLRYLLSGGFTLRQLVPSFGYFLVRAVEYVLSPLNNCLGMFQTIELEKTSGHIGAAS